MSVKSVFIGLLTLLFVSCELKVWRNADGDHDDCVRVERYDRLESRYLSTGDYSALQQMNTDYPIETRTLIEKVLQLGSVEDFEIHKKFFHYFQDSTLQRLIADIGVKYMSLKEQDEELCKAFHQLRTWLPGLPLPRVYAQIGSLDQSIIVGDSTIGISLDKYMGEDYPLYKKYYTREQMKSMGREFIVPDALSFYLLSRYPLNRYETRSQTERDLHMAKLMWVVNKAMGRTFFDSPYMIYVTKYMCSHPKVSVEELIESDNYRAMLP